MATVLVVEDNEALRQLVTMILQQKGYDVLGAANGLEGLMVYSSYRARLDLVLTDIDMPQMNGIVLATRIRALDKFKKIMFMSGASDDKEGLGSCPLLSKPFRPDELIAAVEAVLKAETEPVT